MAEVLLRYETQLRTPDGRAYTAQACGRELDDGRRWEGWIEFIDPLAGDAVRTGQETVQPTQDTLRYWATGLSFAYLEGALVRALAPRPTPQQAPEKKPAFSGPAPRTSSPSSAGPRAILDPFQVRLQGEDVLRDELVALDTMHLRNIALAYSLADEETVRNEKLGRAQLAELIVSAVAQRSAEQPGQQEP